MALPIREMWFRCHTAEEIGQAVGLSKPAAEKEVSSLLEEQPKAWEKAGEILRGMVNKGRPEKGSNVQPLSELGITKTQSSRWQRASIAEWSDRRISEVCGVSNHVVARIRPEMVGQNPTTRIGKDGVHQPAKKPSRQPKPERVIFDKRLFAWRQPFFTPHAPQRKN